MKEDLCKTKMNYLFFDVECAKCGKNGVGFICEFGYVITSPDFEVLEQGHYMINPDHSFDKYALKNILQHSKEEYESSPLFSEFYPQIAALLDSSKYLIVGHTTAADRKYILSECRRYGLPELTYKYFDIRVPFMVLQNEENPSKLEKMLLKLELEKPGNLHDAKCDALSTMMVCKELCRKFSKTIEEMLNTKKPSKKQKHALLVKKQSTLGDLLKAKGIDLAQMFKK